MANVSYLPINAFHKNHVGSERVIFQ